jgi:hypothetical protein
VIQVNDPFAPNKIWCCCCETSSKLIRMEIRNYRLGPVREPCGAPAKALSSSTYHYRITKKWRVIFTFERCVRVDAFTSHTLIETVILWCVRKCVNVYYKCEFRHISNDLNKKWNPMIPTDWKIPEGRPTPSHYHTIPSDALALCTCQNICISRRLVH